MSNFRYVINKIVDEFNLILITLDYENQGPNGDSHWNVELDVKDIKKRPKLWNHQSRSDTVYVWDSLDFIRELTEELEEEVGK